MNVNPARLRTSGWRHQRSCAFECDREEIYRKDTQHRADLGAQFSVLKLDDRGTSTFGKNTNAVSGEERSLLAEGAFLSVAAAKAGPDVSNADAEAAAKQ